MKDIYFLIGLVVAETILNFFLVFLSNYIAQNVIRDIRERLYHKLIYFKTFLIKLLSEIWYQSSRRCRDHCYGLYGWIFDGFRRYFESGFRFGSDVSGEYRAELYFAYHFTYHVGDYKFFPEKIKKSIW